ncbi:phosphorylated adapter RNA export protein-like [Lytechinus pictus]|uniref:phosphorylated adapter RNA export protein-like n=1 Tax=Lytechinus pictus TaxID=7653 RepID=UPI0030B9CE1D
MAAFTQRQTTPKKKDLPRGSIRKFELSDEDDSSDQSDSDDEQSWKRRKTAPALSLSESSFYRDQQKQGKSSERPDNRSSRMKDGDRGVVTVGKRRKNNIWGSVAVEQNQEVVEREITHFGVDQVMERDVESYSYKDTEQLPLGVATNIPPGDDVIKGRKLVKAVGEDEDDAWLANDPPRHSEQEEEELERPHDDLREKLKKRGSMVADRFRRSNVKSRLGNHSDSTEQVVLMKKVEIDPSAEKKVIAGQLAFSLQEPKRELILRIVKILGVEKALQIWKQTEEIENDGGMMIANQSRRRSPGGVFIQLMKTDPDISKETIKDIFAEEKKIFEAERKKRRRHTRKSAAFHKDGDDHPGNREEEMEEAGFEGDGEAVGEMDMRDDRVPKLDDEPCVNEMEPMPDEPSNLDPLDCGVPLPQKECSDIKEDNDNMMFPKLDDIPQRNDDSDPEDGEVLDDD